MVQIRESVDVQLRASRRSLQTISTFAQAVGLSASALRQYGDNGLLVPTEVEERTGYRYYAPDQQQRAIWIRRLRDAGLSLERIRTVLDGEAAGAMGVLDEWLTGAHERSAAAEELVTDLKLSLQARFDRNPTRRTCVRFDAMVLASAVRQVLAASADGDPDFDGVLIDAGSDSAAVTSTDRYILMGRTDVATDIDGPPARVRFDPGPALEWLGARRHVELVIEAPIGRDHPTVETRVGLRDSQGEMFALNPKPDRFPSVHQVRLEESDVSSRVLFKRDDVLSLVASTESQSVLLTSDGDDSRLALKNRSISGLASGAPTSLELSLRALVRIADAAVGPELVCDISDPNEAIAWCAPSQPDFVAFVMPRRS
jgi:DNA polymerase-3 subunit beta